MLIRFLQNEVGEVDLHPKKPMFVQNFEHILDTIGLDTPAAMQCKRIRWKYFVILYASNS